MKNLVDFEPLNKDILVVIPVVFKKTKSGIIKSEALMAEEQKKLGGFLRVAAVSKQVDQVKVGDSVYISNGKHSQIILNGIAYMVINEIHILGKKVNL